MIDLYNPKLAKSISLTGMKLVRKLAEQLGIEMTSQNKIASACKKIKTKIEDLNQQLISLQAECTHPNVVKTYHGDTGNYDPSCNRYWTKFNCPDCGKWWTEEK